MSGPEPAGPWSPRPHALTYPLFADLARGGGGSAGMRLLADAEYSRRLLTLWAVRRAATQYGGDVESRARAAWQVLAEAQRRSPDTVRALVAYPAVGPALLRTLHALTSGRAEPPPGADASYGVAERHGRAEAYGLAEAHGVAEARGAGVPYGSMERQGSAAPRGVAEPYGAAGSYDPAGARGAAEPGLPAAPGRAGATCDPLHALTSLAAAAVVATGLPARVDVALRDRRIVLPGLGAVCPAGVADGSWAVVEGGPSGAWVAVGGRRIAVGAGAEHSAGRRPDPSEPAAWQPLRAIGPSGAPGGGVLFDDVDPYTPVVHGRFGRLSDAAWEPWRQRLGAGWRLLHREHPEVAAEAAVVLRAAVPIPSSPGVSRSSSSQETFGAVALSLPDSAEGVALALVHELQHNKLSALLHLFDLTAERPGDLFYAPWRDDPRPLVGLLQGTYAHLGVARFWLRRTTWLPAGAPRREAQAQFARWRAATAEAAATLAGSGRLTRDGTLFVAGMNEALAEMARVPVPSAATTEAAARAAAHRRVWTARHRADDADGRSA